MSSTTSCFLQNLTPGYIPFQENLTWDSRRRNGHPKLLVGMLGNTKKVWACFRKKGNKRSGWHTVDLGIKKSQREKIKYNEPFCWIAESGDPRREEIMTVYYKALFICKGVATNEQFKRFKDTEKLIEEAIRLIREGERKSKDKQSQASTDVTTDDDIKRTADPTTNEIVPTAEDLNKTVTVHKSAIERKLEPVSSGTSPASVTASDSDREDLLTNRWTAINKQISTDPHTRIPKVIRMIPTNNSAATSTPLVQLASNDDSYQNTETRGDNEIRGRSALVYIMNS
jgi:hypothetical protein